MLKIYNTTKINTFQGWKVCHLLSVYSGYPIIKINWQKTRIFSIQTNRLHHLDLISRIFSHGNFPLMSWIVCLSKSWKSRQNHNDCCRHLIIITSRSSNPYFLSYSSKHLINGTTYKHYGGYFGGFRYWATKRNFGASSWEWVKNSLTWLQLVSSFAEERTEHVNSNGKLFELIKPTYHEWSFCEDNEEGVD